MFLYGRGVEGGMDRAAQNSPTPQHVPAIRQGTLNTYLNYDTAAEEEGQPKQQFADPAAMAAQGKIKIKKG